jgi:cystathionine gamma-synthase
MELNSRNFTSRVDIVNANAQAICTYLRARSLSFLDSGSSFAIKEVFYPAWITCENYEIARRSGRGYGSLFSLTFVSLAAAQAFYNALSCSKGPSLGTNFTLACPYTILAHFFELEWAAKYNVEEGLVRVSIGLEERDVLMEWFRHSVELAEAVVKVGSY